MNNEIREAQTNTDHFRIGRALDLRCREIDGSQETQHDRAGENRGS